MDWVIRLSYHCVLFQEALISSIVKAFQVHAVVRLLRNGILKGGSPHCIAQSSPIRVDLRELHASTCITFIISLEDIEICNPILGTSHLILASIEPRVTEWTADGNTNEWPRIHAFPISYIWRALIKTFDFCHIVLAAFAKLALSTCHPGKITNFHDRWYSQLPSKVSRTTSAVLVSKACLVIRWFWAWFLLVILACQTARWTQMSINTGNNENCYCCLNGKHNFVQVDIRPSWLEELSCECEACF